MMIAWLELIWKLLATSSCNPMVAYIQDGTEGICDILTKKREVEAYTKQASYSNYYYFFFLSTITKTMMRITAPAAIMIRRVVLSRPPTGAACTIMSPSVELHVRMLLSI